MELMMKFILSWTIKPENRNEALRRVLSKENLAVDGITILGHWHNVNLLNGWALVEADNEATIAKWLMDWTDLNVNELTPVIDEAELRQLSI